MYWLKLCVCIIMKPHNSHLCVLGNTPNCAWRNIIIIFELGFRLGLRLSLGLVKTYLKIYDQWCKLALTAFILATFIRDIKHNYQRKTFVPNRDVKNHDCFINVMTFDIFDWNPTFLTFLIFLTFSKKYTHFQLWTTCAVGHQMTRVWAKLLLPTLFENAVTSHKWQCREREQTQVIDPHVAH